MKDPFALSYLVILRRLLLNFVVLISSFFGSLAFAQTEFTGTASLALGGTGRAAVRPEEVGLLNPATLVHARGYTFSSGYRDVNVRDEGSIYNSYYHVSESQTQSAFPLGVTYLKTRNFYLPFVDRREDLHLSTGLFVKPHFSIGLDVSYNRYKTDTESEKDWDATLGLLYVFKKSLGLSFTYHNFLNSDLYYLERKYGFGSSYIFKEFLRFFFDFEYQVNNNPKDEARYMLGFEHVIEEMYAARAGLRFDDFGDSNYWTLGFGFMGPRLGLNYGFEKNFSRVSEYSHTVDLRLQFQ